MAGRVRPGARSSSARSTADEPVYGLTTGVGVRKRTRVEPSELAEFNRRLILEHRVGQGDAAPDDVVRAQLLLVVNGFARGTAGVRLSSSSTSSPGSTRGATPLVRMLGSIGMADLPANADLAHGVLDGFELAAKEGLALLDHNAFSTGLAALALADAARLLDALDVAAALDLEALVGEPVDPPPRRRPRGRSSGCARCSTGATSGTRAPRATSRTRSASAACRRCTARRTTRFDVRAATASQRELNASQENPLVLLDEERVDLGRELRRGRRSRGARLRPHRARARADERLGARR